MIQLKKRRILTVLLALAIAILVYQKRSAFWQIVSVFVYALAFTLILSPLCRMLERRGIGEKPAAALCVLLFVMCAVLILAAFLPYLATHSIELIRRITPTLMTLLSRTGDLLSQLGIQIAQQKGVADMIAGGMSHATAVLARGSMAVAAQAGQIVFSLVIAYYLLGERKKVACHLMLLIPIAWRNAFLSGVLGCKNAVLSYLSGVLKTSLFVMLATFAGLLVLGVHDALLLAVFMGIFEILPYIGPVLGAIPILLSAFSQGFYTAMLALAVVVGVQQIEGNFISPYFTASSTSIHPLAALVSVFVMGTLMGLWGIMLAVPLVVMLRSVLWSFRQASNLMNA